jgi:hypothetical protein
MRYKRLKICYWTIEVVRIDLIITGSEIVRFS